MTTSNAAISSDSPASVDTAFFPGFTTLRDLLDLVAILRDTSEPIDSPEGLRRAIDGLLKLGQSLGLDPELLAKLRTLIENPRIFEVMLAVARYLVDLIDRSSSELVKPLVDLEPHAVDPGTWLAIILEVIALLRRLRERS